MFSTGSIFMHWMSYGQPMAAALTDNVANNKKISEMFHVKKL